VASVRWGILVVNHSPTYDFLMAFRTPLDGEVVISWQSGRDAAVQKAHFDKLVDAALNYVLPHVMQRVQAGLEADNEMMVGPCVLSSAGVQLETRGWFSTKRHLVPWQSIDTRIENGALLVRDSTNPKVNVSLGLRETENAIVLYLLASSKR
jgi:hypothetical protein